MIIIKRHQIYRIILIRKMILTPESHKIINNRSAIRWTKDRLSKILQIIINYKSVINSTKSRRLFEITTHHHLHLKNNYLEQAVLLLPRQEEILVINKFKDCLLQLYHNIVKILATIIGSHHLNLVDQIIAIMADINIIKRKQHNKSKDRI